MTLPASPRVLSWAEVCIAGAGTSFLQPNSLGHLTVYSKN